MWPRLTLLAALVLASVTIGVGAAASAPGIGVYRGEGRTDRVDRFERWLGVDVAYAVDFIKNVGWTPRGAILGPWRRSSYTLSLSVALEPHPAKDWKALARRLKPGTLVRLGWEMNGTWFPWSGEPARFVRGWRRATSFMLQANPDLLFEWSPIAGSGNNPEPYYPGDAFVDVIGLDIYNTQSWTAFREHAWGTT